MTRSEFERIVRARWGAFAMSMPQPRVLTSDTTLESMGQWLASHYLGLKDYPQYMQAIAEVATNGLEPEIPSVTAYTMIGGWPSAQLIVPNPGGKPHFTAAPFIGSHNLPHDTDWD